MVLPTHGTAPQFTRTRAPHSNTNRSRAKPPGAVTTTESTDGSLADSDLSRVNAVSANRRRAVVPWWSVWS